MRDAFGGISMIRILLVFIVILVGFAAVSLNYAKAFRVKNKVLDFVEQQEIQKISTVLSDAKKLQKLNDIVSAAGYNVECKKSTYKNESGTISGICYNGITIIETKTDTKHIYYDVITYGGWNLPALNMLLELGGKAQDSEDIIANRWKVVGEVKVARKI